MLSSGQELLVIQRAPAPHDAGCRDRILLNRCALLRSRTIGWIRRDHLCWTVSSMLNACQHCNLSPRCWCRETSGLAMMKTWSRSWMRLAWHLKCTLCVSFRQLHCRGANPDHPQTATGQAIETALTARAGPPLRADVCLACLLACLRAWGLRV